MSYRFGIGTAFSLSLALSAALAAVASAGSATSFPLRVGAQMVQVEIALTPEEQSRGLMFRRSLEENSGMLFVFPRSKRMSFWMRNTAIPLDIGFFDADGILREIHELEPFEERPVVSKSDELQYALEVNRGWFAAHGVAINAALDLPMLAEILARNEK